MAVCKKAVCKIGGKWRSHRLVQMMADGVCQGADGVVEDQKVLVLIFPERKHQCVQNETEIWNQLGARLLLQSRKRTEKNITALLYYSKIGVVRYNKEIVSRFFDQYCDFDCNHNFKTIFPYDFFGSRLYCPYLRAPYVCINV